VECKGMEKVLLSVFLGICILEADDVFGTWSLSR